MLLSTVRFWANGWIKTQFVEPQYHFKYWGLEFIEPLSETGFYILYSLMVIACILIILGYFYRWAALFFFLAFTYTELIDITYYLNHYYFISMLSGLMFLLPMNVYFSLDVYFNRTKAHKEVPNWTILSIKLLLSIVYFYAGLAKLHSDWLFHAQPLSIWLQAHQDWWLIGPLFTKQWFAYAMSWMGCLYDLAIPFVLFNRKTTYWGFIFVVFFHIFTRMLFPIGMFPYIMIVATTIFFPVSLHHKIIGFLRNLLPKKEKLIEYTKWKTNTKRKYLLGFLAAFFAFQLLFPFRYVLYPGSLFWTEQGFRFSWRVMLIEKGGTAFFYIQNPKTGKKHEINNRDFLTPLQEKMMSTQPDLIIQYAKIIEKDAIANGIKDPVITADIYVSLNGRKSKKYIDPNIDLTKVDDTFAPKTWILPFK
jgi:uncharacterized membrane protein YphA (DoxX/SURF4 family)